MNAPVSGFCACGSGLRAERCCAWVGTAVAGVDPAGLVERALQAHRQGAVGIAERLCLEALDGVPNQAAALSLLFQIRKAQGNQTAAEILIRRVAALDPNSLAATNELALLLLGKGALAEAEIHARNAVRIAPRNPQAHNLMGMVMTEAERPRVGEYHYRMVLELTGSRDPIVLANLAWNLKNQGRMEESRALYAESVAAAPDVRQTLLGWARLEEADRKFDAAAEKLDRMDRLWPDDPGLLLTRAVLLGRMKRHDDALAALDRSARHSAQRRLGPAELAEKGRLLDQMGRYDDAWAAFAEGKRVAREMSGNQYADAAAGNLISRLRGFFIAPRLETLPRAGVRGDVAQPIFVLGFPRSGTTLVEQTLSAHPRIAAGDELPLIPEISAIMPRLLNSPLAYPEALSELWMGDQRAGLDNLRDHYLQKVAQMDIAAAGESWFTDKMPLNEMHLGLIAMIFPASPLLHVIRHPLDVVLSVFSNNLTHGFFCAYELEGIARHMLLVADLVAHYRAEMALRYLPVRYEDIVAGQEASLRGMLDFVGETFDPACLSFHENRRHARTASYAQVTEKLYDTSRFRYRNYLRHLEPVAEILAPLISRLDYTV